MVLSCFLIKVVLCNSVLLLHRVDVMTNHPHRSECSGVPRVRACALPALRIQVYWPTGARVMRAFTASLRDWTARKADVDAGEAGLAGKLSIQFFIAIACLCKEKKKKKKDIFNNLPFDRFSIGFVHVCYIKWFKFV